MQSQSLNTAESGWATCDGRLPLSPGVACEVSYSRFAEERHRKPKRVRSDVLRAFDIAIALAALLFFLPLFLIITLIVLITDPGPVFFAHKRIGYGGKPFYCLKFRSMAVDAHDRLERLLAADACARQEWLLHHKLRNDPRITRVGAMLRKTSLDELPQLLNVLKGDMSLVGPRPIVADEIQRYGRYFVHYCRVRPGITGLWQVSGRSDVSYRRRVAFDVVYTRSYSVALNTKILLFTIPCVLRQRGSY
jgi:exopolysaccharide production protein ExoY